MTDYRPFSAAELDAMYPSMREPAPLPADATQLERLYPNSPEMHAGDPDWLPQNLEPGLAAMYPTCVRMNREAQERAFLARTAPDLSERDRWAIAETLAGMPYEKRNAIVGQERARAVELLRAGRGAGTVSTLGPSPLVAGSGR